MFDQQSLDYQIYNTYRKRANRFFFEVVAIQIASIIVATVVLVAMGTRTDGLILLALLSIGVSYLVVTLLFRHVDTLILIRLTQLEEGLLSHSTDTDSTAKEGIGGETRDE